MASDKSTPSGQNYTDRRVGTDTLSHDVGDDAVSIEREQSPNTTERWTRRATPPSGPDIRGVGLDLARSARDAFNAACSSDEADQADLSFHATVRTLSQLWDHAQIRDQPFRDLLAALEAALKGRSINNFDADQRVAIQLALADLSRWFLDDAVVVGHLERLTECGVNLLAPILPPPIGKKFRIILEEVSPTDDPHPPLP